MASFILLLGLCALAVANPLASATNDVTLLATDDFSANVTTHATVDESDTAHIPLSTSYVGCYREATGTRALSRATLTHPRLTIGVCQDFCKGYRYYGLEFGNECYCGYKLHDSTYQVPDSACALPCIGDLTQTCGGGNLLSLYKSNLTMQVPKVNYTPQGCYAEPQNSRALHRVLATDKLTSNKCLVLCSYSNYKYAGLQYGSECWCGNTLDPLSKLTDPSKCATPCGGNSSETCGGSLTMQLYVKDFSPVVLA
ncbi:WSC domain-containing protein [Diaporthe sp. PMI_573]|nr:WSC domain-containing protein [Diaporthaceae sp. PMI_573]